MSKPACSEAVTRFVMHVLGRDHAAVEQATTLALDRLMRQGRYGTKAGLIKTRTLSKAPGFSCIETPVQASAPLESLRCELRLCELPEGVDAVIQSEAGFSTPKRLAVFDMDSTLITVEVIDEIAKRAGVGPAAAAITEQAMAGELDFDASLKARVSFLKGLPETELDAVAKELEFTPGAPELLQALQAHGCVTALASGGFSCFAQSLQRRVPLDHTLSNTFEVKDGRLTGVVIPPIVNGAAKAAFLESLALALGISTESIVAVGDGANDIAMLQRAGLGIAFNAKPKTRAAAAAALNQASLMTVLFLLGIDA